MVRLSWTSKPTIEKDRLLFPKSGRVSEVTNKYLNELVSRNRVFGIDCIITGNSGEHAAKMDLIERMPLASGYAIEPYEFIYLLEEFGGVEKGKKKIKGKAEIIQIETRDPHFHEKGDEEHIKKMRECSLATIYYSHLCEEDLKKEIEKLLNKKPEKPSIYPPIEKVNINKFKREIDTTTEKIGN